MTSSLVGSEMCIREQVLKGEGSSAVRKTLINDERGMVLSILGYDTVSYTHLTLPTICSV
eukprot:9634596-Prorocentrum_lima.AAC.1